MYVPCVDCWEIRGHVNVILYILYTKYSKESDNYDIYLRRKEILHLDLTSLIMYMKI